MKTILVTLLLLASALDVRAGERLSYSLEWLADTSPSIGIYTTAPIIAKPWNNHTVFSPNLNLKDSLKGKPPALLKFDSPQDEELPVAPGDRIMVFFWTNRSAQQQPVQIINLAHPGGVRGPPQFLAMNAKFEPLTDGDAILRTVRDRMAAHPGTFPAQDGRAALEISGAPAFAKIKPDGNGGYSLMVPVDLQPERVARHDLQEIIEGLNAYYRDHHVMPSGDPAKIVKTIASANLLPADILKIRANAAGEFLDPWGTPYRIDTSNPKSPRAWSCGPYKKDDGGAPGSDDVISW